MQQPGDVVLVSCYELGHQPQGVASAVAFLRRAGFAPTCLDLAVEPLDAAAEARLAAARLVAISVPMHTAMALGLRVAARVRAANPTAHVCFFGLYAVLNRELLASGGVADSVLAPDSEEQLVAIASGGAARARRHLAGATIWSRRVTGCRRSSATRAWRSPASGASPATPRRRAAASTSAVTARFRRSTAAASSPSRSTSCWPTCAGRSRRARATSTSATPTSSTGPSHALRVARALHAEHPGRDVRASRPRSSTSLAHADAVRELAALGALFVVSAVESLSDRVLAALAKGHHAADVGRALAVVRAAPACRCARRSSRSRRGRRSADYLELCSFIRDNRLQDEVDPVQLSIRLLVPPGSLLLAAPDIAPSLGPAGSGGAHLPVDSPRSAHGSAGGRRLGAGRSRRRSQAPRPRTRSRASTAWPRRVAGIDMPADKPRLRLSAPPPHLTEPWFCCAQPTRRQLRAV